MTAAIVYGDISPNVIDGSSIWLMSITEAASSVFDEVHLQLKMAPENYNLLSSIRDIPNVTIHEPQAGKTITAESASNVIEKLIESVDASVVIARGLELCFHLSKSELISRILWSYITDLPFPPSKISKTNLNRLGNISLKSYRLFSQTEASRAYLEAISPAAAGKTLLMRPMIPDSRSSTAQKGSADVLKLVYAGKLAKDWKTLEMLEIPAELKKLGVKAELTVVGGKINRDKSDPTWHVRMKEKLSSISAVPTSGVKWLGSVPRSTSMDIIARSDIGIGWRTQVLDSSLEISTKALEYSTLGIPTLSNLNHDNAQFFPPNYDLFVSSSSTAADAAIVIQRYLQNGRSWAQELQSAASEYSMSAAAERLKVYTRDILRPVDSAKTDTTKVLIASHDFKFMGELINYLNSNPNFEVQVDAWEGLHKHNTRESNKLAAWADVILCEWAGPSVKFFTEAKQPHQRLITRLHGFEIRRAKWLYEVNFDLVDEVIFVSDHYKRLGQAKLNLPESKTKIIPNSIDQLDLQRPKFQNSQFVLGMVGMVPFLKRPDRALDVLEELLQVDSRFVLRIKGKAPWEYPYEWNNTFARQLYLDFFGRIRRSADLRQHVVFDPFSPDIGNWLRGIGFILSPSDHESFHLAPAEGMASGCIPMIWNREGARQIFGPTNVYEDSSSVAGEILRVTRNGQFPERSAKAIEEGSQWDYHRIMREWEQSLSPKTSLK